MPAPEAGQTESPSANLTKRLARRIAQQGPLTLSEYMAAALGDRQHGYYMRGDPFGARGDFITAPEISQIFGELLGMWCADTWDRMGSPSPVHLVELGPGRGTLMADALRAARALPAFHDALRPHLVELSPALRGLQRGTLEAAAARLTAPPKWHDSLSSVPQGPLLLIANEFFDALPIRQFVRRDDGWCERMVALNEDGRGLAFVLRPATMEATALLPREAEATPPGGTFEICPAALGIATKIGGRLAAHRGAALIVDYGAARPLGEPTLQALRRHARHEVLEDPGHADLTAHVDFGALARAAQAAGATAWGPTPQGRFLGSLGIGPRAETLAQGADTAQAEAIAAAVQRLTGPDDMGTLFKALALTHPDLAAPSGFEPAGAAA